MTTNLLAPLLVKYEFFPNVGFAWTSMGLLSVAVGIAAYTDTKTGKVRNPLVVSMLAVGLILNVVRGAWQAGEGHLGWVLDITGNPWLGGLDGLLFGVGGFVLGFGVFFLLWMIGMVGGGDVKLFAALGGWLGVPHLIVAWLVSVGALLIWTLAKLISKGLSPSRVHAAAKQLKRSNPNTRTADPSGKPNAKMRVTYSLPIAVAVILTAAFFYRYDLNLQPRPAQVPPVNTGAKTNDSPTPEPAK